MPEGHIVHRLARELSTTFAGQRVGVSSPQGRFSAESELLDGRTCLGAEAIGKHLFTRFESPPFPLVHIHLGLIGKLRIDRPGTGEVQSAQTLRLLLRTDTARAELRGPQWCRLVAEDERDRVLQQSGPDPLRSDADSEQAWSKVRRSQRSIGALLMDQGIFAGVGNIFRAEVLFRQAISPFVAGSLLRRPAFEALWADLVELMGQALLTGRIDTVSRQHSPEVMGRAAREDPHGGEVYVYRRAGQPCLVCENPISLREMHGRNLYWCAQCQVGPS